MKMYRTLLLGLLLLTSAAHAQHELLTSYTWALTPTPPDRALVKEASNTIVNRHIMTEIAEEGDRLFGYELFHMLRYLHDDKAVEEFKTVELPMQGADNVIKLMARSISPSGAVTELGKDAIKTRTDDSEQESGIYFAFEGLQPGSMVEYIILTKERVNYQGSLVRLQFDSPIQRTAFELIVPKGWDFRFRGYNGVPDAVLDSSRSDVHRYTVSMQNVAGLPGEKSSYVAVNRGYLVYKLDAIPEKRVLDISGYNTAARNYHGNMYPELSPRTKKELASLVKDMKLGYARDEEDKIRTLDLYIRTNFAVTSNSTPALADLDEIIRTRNASRFGINRLYVNLLREAGIEHQLVLTSDRSASPFDPTFEAHNFLSDLLLYFPSCKKYLEPTEFSLGLGYASPEYMGTHGLYIRNIDVGGVFSGVGSIKAIPDLPAKATRHDLDIHVRFNEDLTSSTVEVRNELFGYYARFLQIFYAYMNEEDRMENVREHLAHLLEGASSETITVENGEAKLFGVQPFVMKATVSSPLFTVQAGNDVLVKVGELIGPQMEMYMEKPRALPVDEDFQRSYDRRIQVHVPAGWTCPDPGMLAIHKTLEVDGKLLAEFRSSATEKDGIITIEAMENYHTTHVPLEHFEAWRSVINAAADFNKRNLLLTRN